MVGFYFRGGGVGVGGKLNSCCLGKKQKRGGFEEISGDVQIAFL